MFLAKIGLHFSKSCSLLFQSEKEKHKTCYVILAEIALPEK